MKPESTRKVDAELRMSSLDAAAGESKEDREKSFSRRALLLWSLPAVAMGLAALSTSEAVAYTDHLDDHHNDIEDPHEDSYYYDHTDHGDTPYTDHWDGLHNDSHDDHWDGPHDDTAYEDHDDHLDTHEDYTDHADSHGDYWDVNAGAQHGDSHDDHYDGGYTDGTYWDNHDDIPHEDDTFMHPHVDYTSYPNP